MWHPSWEWFSVEFLITPFYDHIQNQKWFHLKFQLLLGWDRVSWERLSITKFMIVSTYLLRKQLPMYKKCSLLKVQSLVSWQNALWLANNSSWLMQSCLYLFQSKVRSFKFCFQQKVVRQQKCWQSHVTDSNLVAMYYSWFSLL